MDNLDSSALDHLNWRGGRKPSYTPKVDRREMARRRRIVRRLIAAAKALDESGWVQPRIDEPYWAKAGDTFRLTEETMNELPRGCRVEDEVKDEEPTPQEGE